VKEDDKPMLRSFQNCDSAEDDAEGCEAAAITRTGTATEGTPSEDKRNRRYLQQKGAVTVGMMSNITKQLHTSRE
jgi:hypothetical protein